jgi:hypothetical protein
MQPLEAKPMMEETKLRLSGEMAKPFLKYKIGDKIKLTVEAVLTSAGLEPDYSAEMPKGKDKQTPKRAACEFVIAEINGKGAKSYEEMSSGEMEDEIHKVKNSDDEE